MSQHPPERVRVTGPPRRPSRRRTRTSEIDDQTALGDVLMRSLLRSQLRLAIGLLLPLAVFAAGLPLLFHQWPHLAATEVLRVPIAWLLLGFASYPALFLMGAAYVRRAERNEQDFADLLEAAEGD